MVRDYRATIAALRRKADDPAVPKAERDALLARASEMEANHKDDIKPVTDPPFVFPFDFFTQDPFGNQYGRPGYTAYYAYKSQEGKTYWAGAQGYLKNIRFIFPDDFYDETYGRNEDTDEEGMGW